MAASRSRLATMHSDFDAESSLLIARLSLTDIDEIDASRKGKGRADAPLSDEEIAMQAQEEYLQAYMRMTEDYRVARSLHDALGSDQDYLEAWSVIDRAERDDHQAALALSRGEPLPPPSAFQRSLEEMAFPTPSWVIYSNLMHLFPDCDTTAALRIPNILLMRRARALQL